MTLMHQLTTFSIYETIRYQTFLILRKVPFNWELNGFYISHNEHPAWHNSACKTHLILMSQHATLWHHIIMSHIPLFVYFFDKTTAFANFVLELRNFPVCVRRKIIFVYDKKLPKWYEQLCLGLGEKLIAKLAVWMIKIRREATQLK